MPIKTEDRFYNGKAKIKLFVLFDWHQQTKLFHENNSCQLFSVSRFLSDLVERFPLVIVNMC